jgi:protein PhnA
MAKGYDTHQERLQNLSLFGKDLTRRCKATCELSGTSGVPLKIYEIPPAPNDPDIERCLMLSEPVIAQLERPQSIIPDQWRNLGELIWSDIPAVQIMSHRILTYIAKSEIWAQDILDNAYLDDDIITASEQSPL